MDEGFWLKQGDKPLFPDLIWSRPENRSQAGKLNIIGGNAQEFSVPAQCYTAALKAGAGSLRVLLPDSLKNGPAKTLEDAWFCPSNKSGSFSKQSLAEFMDAASWADLTLLAGNFGNNSETAVLIESFVSKYNGLLTLSGDAVDLFINDPDLLINRPNTLLVVEFNQLQKMFAKASRSYVFKSTMSLIQLTELLAQITSEHQMSIVTNFERVIVVASNGSVSTTNRIQEKHWQTDIAGYSSVWWLQNTSRTFEALTSAIFESQSKQ